MIWYKYQIQMWDNETKQWRTDHRFYLVYTSVESDDLFEILDKRRDTVYLGQINTNHMKTLLIAYCLLLLLFIFICGFVIHLAILQHHYWSSIIWVLLVVGIVSSRIPWLISMIKGYRSLK